MTKPSYRTVPLQRYSLRFRRVADRIFALTREHLAPKQLRRGKGSYSIIAASTQETTAKILIFERVKGSRTFGRWPLQSEGVYVLIRTNGEAAKNIWDDIAPDELSWFFESRLNRGDTIAVAPNHAERFAYFPVMAGEDLSEIGILLAACAAA
ncbi:MAG TPA: hypothetical protein VLB32_07980 [Candidatus Acidoferrales bacterium]|nr:hypothetical protein [Candidatus Acidoferrales bacterium]